MHSRRDTAVATTCTGCERAVQRAVRVPQLQPLHLAHRVKLRLDGAVGPGGDVGVVRRV
jgi:hypothetical protein